MAGALAEADTKQSLTVDELVALGEPGLRGVVGLCGRAQRELDGLTTRAARALKILEESGSGPVADDVLRGEGKVSARKAKRQAARARTAKRFPKVGVNPSGSWSSAEPNSVSERSERR